LQTDEREPASAGLGVVLEDVGPGDVRRHHVGRELDAPEREARDPRHRADEQRLGQPGHPDEQDVPAGEQACEELLDHVLLADDDLADLRAEPAVILRQRGDGRGIIAGQFGRGGGRHAGGPRLDSVGHSGRSKRAPD
jgi:hypothetical protein